MRSVSIAVVTAWLATACSADDTCATGQSTLLYELPFSDRCADHVVERHCRNGAWEEVDSAFQFVGCAPAAAPSYRTGFETLADFEGFYLTPQDHRGTTSHELSPAQVHSGSLAHRAWFDGVNPVIDGENTNHRGYPTIQLWRRGGPVGGAVVVELWVWLDITLGSAANADWFSFATFTSYADEVWPRTQLVNLDANGIVHLMHVPTQGAKVHDIFQTTTITYPQRQWVKLTVLLDYRSDNPYGGPYARVWQDDVLVSAARFSPRLTPADAALGADLPCVQAWDQQSIESLEQTCGLTYGGEALAQAHFGMYAPPLLGTGQVFNDDLTIATFR